MKRVAAVLVACILGGCEAQPQSTGGADSAGRCASASENRAALVKQGGVRLTYAPYPISGEPAEARDELHRTADVICARAAKFGFGKAYVDSGDVHRLTVWLPGVMPGAMELEWLGTPGVLSVYDWESSLVGPAGRPYAAGVSPGALLTDRQAVFESLTAGDVAGGLTLRLARARAAKRRGAIVLQAIDIDRKKATPADDPSARFYVLLARPALSGADIRDPKQDFQDTRPGSPAVVSFDFTKRGATRFHAATRAIARRGRKLLHPPLPLGGRTPLLQQFAVALDRRLVSVASIDPRELPDGIDGRNGAVIEGRFTIESAQRLVNLLRLGRLPVDLRLRTVSAVRASG